MYKRRYGRRKRASARRRKRMSLLRSSKRMYRRVKKYRRGRIKYRKMGIARSLAPKTKLIQVYYTDMADTNNSPLWNASGVRQFYQYTCRIDPYGPAPSSMGGHQPMLWDQISSLYQRCIVIGAKVKWHMNFTGDLQYSNATLPPIVYGHYWGKNVSAWPTTVNGDINQWRENAATTRELTYREIPATQLTRTHTYTAYYSCRKFWDIRNLKDNLPSFAQATNNRPNNTAWSVFAVAPYDAAPATNPQPVLSVRCRYSIVFKVLCYDPYLQTQN